MATADVLRNMLLYFILPLWLAAGFADYLCHRASHIERTSGWRESLLHLLQFSELALPLLAALVFEINTAIVGLMIVCLILHEATAIWDLRLATRMREVAPVEQHVHSVLEMLPLTALLMVIALHWDAFAGLFGFAEPDFNFRPKAQPLPWAYVTTLLAVTFLFEILPYGEELVRGLRERGNAKP